MEPITDPLRIVLAAREGDRTAFGQLVAAHWGRLVRLARSVVGEGDAEDLVQDSLLRAWHALPNLREPSAFTTWLTRSVLRRCLRHRQRHPLAFALTDVSEPHVQAGGTDGIEAARLLARLAPRQRAVMHLTVVEGLEDQEIAGLLAITAAAVRSHRRRAREAIARHLEPTSPFARAVSPTRGGVTP